jgi:uncharacterized repeat protein (TIGR03803 family)
MSGKNTPVLLVVIFGVLCEFLTTATPALAAAKEKVLHSFCSASGCPDGAYSYFASLNFDAAGNLYGTTPQGGAHDNGGTVFELVPGANGAWTETVLYSFCTLSGCADGGAPNAGLIFDASGDLYGTTTGGGAYGWGTVFELTSGANGTWSEKVLYSFCSTSNCADGAGPSSKLVFDASGNLYGTTSRGGNSGCKGDGCGIVFELAPNANGEWNETVLHNFDKDGFNSKAGGDAFAGLIFDPKGNLYGTTRLGGSHSNCQDGGCGTVFSLTPSANKWTFKVLHIFSNDGTDGYWPMAGVVVDPAGNLYGTTSRGGHGCGRDGCGTAYRLVLGANGKWAETVLRNFIKSEASLIFDVTGNLYGTTWEGGTYGWGTAFKLKHGTWTKTVLHNFGNGKDGQEPFAGLVFDPAGNLYGTTLGGGSGSCTGGCGTVFEITP